MYRVFKDQVDLSEALQLGALRTKMLTICFLNFSSWYNFVTTLKTPFVSQKVQFFASYISPKKSRKNQEKMENRQKWLKIVKNDKNKMSKMVKNWNFSVSDIFCNYVYQKSPWNGPKMTIFISPILLSFFGGKFERPKN